MSLRRYLCTMSRIKFYIELAIKCQRRKLVTKVGSKLLKNSVVTYTTSWNRIRKKFSPSLFSSLSFHEDSRLRSFSTLSKEHLPLNVFFSFTGEKQEVLTKKQKKELIYFECHVGIEFLLCVRARMCSKLFQFFIIAE
jgi:hypothetical protein